MDLPVSFMGWANLLSGAWAAVAYLAAAVAGFRALKSVTSTDHVPAFPACLIAAATRWLFFRPVKARWNALDFIALGIFGLSLACLFSAVSTADFFIGLDWRKVGHIQSLQRFAADILTGSALIVLFAGISHLYDGVRNDRPQ
jgi:hypothetical protein